MSLAEELLDTAHDNLLDVASSIRPPDSDRDIRHCPDAALLESVVVQVVIPVMTSIIGGIITYWVTTARAEASAESELAEIKKLLADIQQRGLAAANEENFREAVKTVSSHCREIGESSFADMSDAEQKVSATLQAHHLDEATAGKKAKIIVRDTGNKIIDANDIEDA